MAVPSRFAAPPPLWVAALLAIVVCETSAWPGVEFINPPPAFARLFMMLFVVAVNTPKLNKPPPLLVALVYTMLVKLIMSVPVIL